MTKSAEVGLAPGRNVVIELEVWCDAKRRTVRATFFKMSVYARSGHLASSEGLL